MEARYNYLRDFDLAGGLDELPDLALGGVLTQGPQHLAHLLHLHTHQNIEAEPCHQKSPQYKFRMEARKDGS